MYRGTLNAKYLFYLDSYFYTWPEYQIMRIRLGDIVARDPGHVQRMVKNINSFYEQKTRRSSSLKHN